MCSRRPGIPARACLVALEGNSMARRITRTLLAFAGAMLLSTAAYAQSAIVGVVKDSSGAAMPGVTVEAASDVLIEKVKSAIRTATAPIASPTSGPAPTRDVHADRLQDVQARRPGAAVGIHRDAQRRTRRRLARGNHHRHRRLAGRRRDLGGEDGGAQPRSDRPDPDRPQHPGPGAARRRRQPEPAGHRRRARDAADLHVDARHDAPPTPRCWSTAR